MIRNVTKSRILARKAEFARNPLHQTLGLMFRLKDTFLGRGMIFNFYIENNKMIHTFFMRFAIDILFLDGKKQVTKIVRNVKPWRWCVSGRAKYIIELSAGNSLNTSVGDRISFK